MSSNNNRKKTRISKHVIKSKDKDKKRNQKQPKKEKPAKIIKDPKEAAAYLSEWKYREQGGTWKFNKNTQSWLLRHMYDTDKISKVCFVILLEYMDGLQGSSRKRVLEDAQRRALRYKKFEKELGEKEKTSEGDKVVEEPEKRETQKDIKASKISTDGEDDETRWNRLDEHDKRKEYKRGRKVIELLQKEQSA